MAEISSMVKDPPVSLRRNVVYGMPVLSERFRMVWLLRDRRRRIAAFISLLMFAIWTIYMAIWPTSTQE